MSAQQWVALGVFVLVGALAWSRSSGAADPPATAHTVVEAGGALVDVRTPEEFAAGHLPGATNIPLGEISARYREIGEPSRPVVVYCKSGMRSAAAATELRSRGFVQVVDLGGMGNW